MLVIRWRSGLSKGYSDLYPSYWFETEGEAHREHDVRTPQGGYHPAKCAVRVQGNIVDVDYGGGYANFNRSEDSHWIGTLQIIFTSEARQAIHEVKWKDEGADSFNIEDVDTFELVIPLEDLEAYDPNDPRRSPKED